MSTWQAVRATRAEARGPSQREAALASKRWADEQAAVAEAVNGFLLTDLLGQSDVGNQIEARQVPDPDIKCGPSWTAPPGASPRGSPVNRSSRPRSGARSARATWCSAWCRRRCRTWSGRSSWRGVLGPEHLYTLESESDLAGAYNALGRPKEAEAHFRAVLEAQRRVRGPEHPLNALRPEQLGDRVHAVPPYGGGMLYRAALEAQRRVRGPEHRAPRS